MGVRLRRYDEQILNKLLDQYENSLLYTGQNKRRQTISVSITKPFLPEYFDETSLQFEVIHAQLEELEQKGFISLVWKNKKAGHLQKCILCTEKADEIYAYLQRRPKQEKEHRILEICSAYAGTHPVVDRFLYWVRARLQQGKTVCRYVDIAQPEQFSERCRLMLAILTNTEEVFWREFSVRFWNDSKIAEKELTAAVHVIQQFWEEDNDAEKSLHDLETEQLLEEFGIYKNPSWVMLKGCGRFCITAAGQQEDKLPEKDALDWISLEGFPGGIGLSSADIASVRWDAAYAPQKVVTIENLTSFHRFQEQGTLSIYLGGYHNKVKRRFLRTLYESFAVLDSVRAVPCGVQVLYEHFGDIDCGGFLIWKDLREKTGIPFRPRQMDEETYLAYAKYGRPLTEHDRKTLKRMAEDPYFAAKKALFAQMLETGKKLEQECVRA